MFVKILKFIVNAFFYFFSLICAIFMFGKTYDANQFEEDMKNLNKPIWK